MKVRSSTVESGSTVSAPWKRSATTAVFMVLLAVLGLSLLAGISVGSTSIAPGIVAQVLAAKLLPHGWIDVHSLREADTVVVWLIRAPRGSLPPS